MIHRNPPEIINHPQETKTIPAFFAVGGGRGKDTEVVSAHLY